MVHVVSIEEVPIRLVISGFQSNEVSGAEKSLSYNKLIGTFLRLSSKLTSLLSLIFQILRHSPEVAIKSGLSPFCIEEQLPRQGWTSILWVGTHAGRLFAYRGACSRWVAGFRPGWRDDYLVVNIGEEWAYGEPEGVLRLVGKAQWKNIPRCSVGDHLVFHIVAVVRLSL